MRRPSSVAGLTLLAALAFCAFAAQGASAAWEPATNLTAYTCVPGGGSLDFSDAHCDNHATEGSGSFGHVLINGQTDIETSNTETKNNTTEAELAKFKFNAFGTSPEITCKKVEPDREVTSFIENEEPSPAHHQVHGTSAINLTECTVVQPLHCVVHEPITIKALFHGVQEPASGTHALEFTPDPPGGSFGKMTFTTKPNDKPCVFNEKAVEVEGTMRATGTPAPTERWSGATTVFTDESTKETLSIAGEPAEFSAKLTMRMNDNGNPISLTTPTA